MTTHIEPFQRFGTCEVVRVTVTDDGAVDINFDVWCSRCNEQGDPRDAFIAEGLTMTDAFALADEHDIGHADEADE